MRVVGPVAVTEMLHVEPPPFFGTMYDTRIGLRFVDRRWGLTVNDLFLKVNNKTMRNLVGLLYFTSFGAETSTSTSAFY